MTVELLETPWPLGPHVMQIERGGSTCHGSRDTCHGLCHQPMLFITCNFSGVIQNPLMISDKMQYFFCKKIGISVAVKLYIYEFECSGTREKSRLRT
jgi:hypothetical protein